MLLQIRRHRRKQAELHGKYLKSERPNPEFEHDETRGDPNGRGGGADGNALARGDDYERLAVQKDNATAAGTGPVTPRANKATTPRAGGHAGAAVAAGAGAGAGAGALGGLLGKKKKVGKSAAAYTDLLAGGVASLLLTENGHDAFTERQEGLKELWQLYPLFCYVFKRSVCTGWEEGPRVGSCAQPLVHKSL